MNDAQTWTLIGGFLAIVTAVGGLLLRVVRLEIVALGAQVNGRIDTLEARLGAKIEHLDRDVQTIVARFLGDQP